MKENVYLTNVGFSVQSQEIVQVGSTVMVNGIAYKVIDGCGLFGTNNFNELGREVNGYLKLQTA